MDDSSQFKFDQIKRYLESHCFPSQFSGDRGLKANLKRQSRGFEVRHGVLYRRHKIHRNEDEGK